MCAARGVRAELPSHWVVGRVEAGCDEAGRGCLAGPVVAAAVILPLNYHLPALNDSKKLSAHQRESLRPLIEAGALAYAVGVVSPCEIDRINILRASILAMNIAVQKLSLRPEHLLIDGNRFATDGGIPFTTIVKGDALVGSIAAASVLAKTYRDAEMVRLAAEYPQYGWEKNMGYPTADHLAALREHGLSPHHRRTFAPCRELLEQVGNRIL